MKRWPVQDAKARFSEFLQASLTEGPQLVTMRGTEKAGMVCLSGVADQAGECHGPQPDPG